MANNRNRIAQQFIVRIPIKNEAGAVVGEKEFVTYAGLLGLAHDIGLEEINTTIVQMPTDANGQTAVVRAIAKGKPGLFTGIGDASPKSVNRRVLPHLLRVAESRAKARALRDLTNVNMVALEELGGDDDIDFEPAPAEPRPPQHQHRRDGRGDGISDAQKRALWRKALTLGHEGQAAHAFLTSRLGVDPAKATREQASKLLDALSAEEHRLHPGNGHAAE